MSDREIIIKITINGWEIIHNNKFYWYNSNIRNDDGLSAIKVLLNDLGYTITIKPIDYN